MSQDKKKATIKGTFQTKDKLLTVNLPVILFQDGSCIVAYCPALNVYGYGLNEEEAKQSFETSLGEFFRYTITKKTFKSELEALGWTVKRKDKYTPPTFSSLLDNNEEFRDIFNTKNFTKFDTGVSIPLSA